MRASINYVENPSDGIVPFVLDYGWTGVTPIPTDVEISDARIIADTLSLDKQGFILERLHSGVTDYSDPDQIEKVWIPAARDLVKRVSGASWVVAWAHNARFSDNSEMATSTPVSAPARSVHADLGTFNPMNIGQEPHGTAAGMEIERRLGKTMTKRWRVFNVWQQISAPPQDTPLAICDVSTSSADDILIGKGTDGTPNSRIFEILFYQQNPKHRWYYFSNMLPGETIIFSGLNPMAEPLLGRAPHTAFDLPEPSKNMIPRESIEVRILAVYDD